MRALIHPEDRLILRLGMVRSPKWPTVRNKYLKAHPTCSACGCANAKVLNVHHILPFHLFPALELDPGNLCTLCESPRRNCHFIFGHFLDWKDWNPEVVAVAASYLAALLKARS